MASAGQQKKRKYKKNYYIQSSKKARSGALEPGMKGILITCNCDEKRCVKEAYNLFDEYADQLYAPESDAPNVENADDFEDNLAREIDALKSEKGIRRFQQVNTMVKNVLFFKTTLPDPIQLVQAIYEDAVKTECRKTRYILKMIPISATCKASVDAYRKRITDLIEEISKTENSSATYKVMCKIRHNSSISKDHLIWYCREAVAKYISTWAETLIDPDIVVSVDVLQSLCCIGILKKYVEYKKYNLSEVVPHGSQNSKAGVVDKCQEKFNPDVPSGLSTESEKLISGSVPNDILKKNALEDCVHNTENVNEVNNGKEDEVTDIDIFSSIK